MTDVQFGLLMANMFLASGYIIKKWDGMCYLMFAIWMLGTIIFGMLQ